MTDAAMSDCRTKKAKILVDFLTNGLTADNNAKVYYGKAMAAANANLEALESLLKEDIAAAVLRSRFDK